jgi:hypothetical protein
MRRRHRTEVHAADELVDEPHAEANVVVGRICEVAIDGMEVGGRFVGLVAVPGQMRAVAIEQLEVRVCVVARELTQVQVWILRS